jgi:hypothetical protein
MAMRTCKKIMKTSCGLKRVEDPFLEFTFGRNPSSAWDFIKNQGIFLWMW